LAYGGSDCWPADRSVVCGRARTGVHRTTPLITCVLAALLGMAEVVAGSPVKQTNKQQRLVAMPELTRNCQPENRKRSGRQAICPSRPTVLRGWPSPGVDLRAGRHSAEQWTNRPLRP